ncbi:MAG: hypothetical protein GYA87_04815 [Christensenellaceae bacterium]|nr:hypothetical protein [Christensenellaceae bacterium]
MKLFKKLSLFLFILLVTVFIYVFLLLGEPNDLSTPTIETNINETITKPCLTMQYSSNTSMQDIINEFARPVLSKDTEPINANLSCDKHGNEYVYNLSVNYYLSNGTKYSIVSSRPIKSIYSTNAEGYEIIAENNVVIASMNGVWAENINTVMIVCNSENTTYKIIFPKIDKDTILLELKNLKLNEPR